MTAEKTAPASISGPGFAPPGDKASLEQGRVFTPKFDEKGLIPCIATDHKTGQVLMFAYMNRDALAKSLETGEVYYWSRSRQTLWHKGATSGHIQKIVEIRIDCDQDVLWIKVDQIGGVACHTGRPSCFYRLVKAAGGGYALDFDGPV